MMEGIDKWTYDGEETEEPLAVLHEPFPAGMVEEVALGSLVELSYNAWAEGDNPRYAVHRCPVCGTDFFDRRNKIYCSRKCRKRAYRLRQRGRLACIKAGKPVHTPQPAKRPITRKGLIRKIRKLIADAEA